MSNVKRRLAELERLTRQTRRDVVYTTPSEHTERSLACAADALAQITGVALPDGLTAAQRAELGREWLKAVISKEGQT